MIHRPTGRLRSPKNYVADTLLTGTDLLQLQQDVQNVAWTQMGHSRSWCWVRLPATGWVGNVPTVRITAAATTTSFQVTSGTSYPLIIPWCMQADYNRVDAVIQYSITHPSLRVQFLLDTLTGISGAVTTATGPWSPESEATEPNPTYALWANTRGFCGGAEFGIQDFATDANGLITFRLRAQLVDDSTLQENEEVSIALINMMMVDSHVPADEG